MKYRQNKIQSIIDRSANTVELNLLLMCLRIYLKIEPQEHLAEFIYYHRAILRWEVFLELCVTHRVYPVVLKILKQKPAIDAPSEIINRLELKRASGLRQSLELAAETVRIAELFENNGIRFIVLKGVSLAIQLYGDVGIRPTHDVDLLVAAADARTACELIKSSGGYTSVYDTFSRNLTNRQLQTVLKASHHEMFQNEKFIVEIHWQLKPYTNRTTDFEKLYCSTTAFRLSDRTLYSIGAHELFDYLALHGAIHGWCRLRWLLDVALLVQQQADELDVSSGAEVNDFSAQALILAGTLLNCFIIREPAVPFTPTTKQIGLAKAAASYIANYTDGILAHFSREYFKRINYTLKIVFDSNYLRNFLRVFFTPNVADFEIISLPDSLFWLYYPLKPFIWLGRATKGWRAGRKSKKK